MLIGYLLMVSLDESRKDPVPFPFPLSPSSWKYFGPGTCIEYGLLFFFLNQGLMKSIRRSRDFCCAYIGGEGTELYQCIGLAFAEARHSSVWKNCSV